MAGLFVLAGLIGVGSLAAAIGTIWGRIYSQHDETNLHKRGLTTMGDEPALFQLNTTNLRGRDVESLKGLRMRMVSADKAVLNAGALDMEGNTTQQNDDGFKHGSLSSQVPGLDAPTAATWVAVDKNATDNERAETAFGKVYELVLNKPEPQELHEALRQIANGL